MKNPEFSEEAIEAELRNLKPAKAPDELVDRLTIAVDRMAAISETLNQKAPELRSSIPARTEHYSWLARLLHSYVTVGAIASFAIVVALWYSIDNASVDEPSKNAANANALSPPKRAVFPGQRDLLPFEVENHLVNAEDDGIVATIKDVPFRRVRYQLIDSYTWKNMSDGSSIRIAVPREEILIIPVSTY